MSSFVEFWKNELELWQKILFVVGIIIALTVFLPYTILFTLLGFVVYAGHLILEWYTDRY